MQGVLRSEQPIPLTVRNILNQPFLSMDLARNIAEHIGSFLARINAFGEVPGGPTACAIVIVGIEAELGHSFPPPVLIAIEKWLGERLSAPFTAIDDRRRAMLVIFNDLASRIPWVLIPANNEESGQFLSMHRVSAIIRAVQDVLQFQNELLMETLLPSYSLGQAPDDTTLESFPLDPPHVERDVHSEGVSQITTKSILPVNSRYRNARRPYGAQMAQRMISQLLDPRFDQKLRLADREDLRDYLSRVELQALSQSEEPLSRLQALCLQRGGELFVTEDELFESGELESYQNTKEVARLLSEIHPEWDATPGRPETRPAQPKKSKAQNMPLPGQISYSDMESDDGDGTDEGGGDGLDSDIDARSLNESRNIGESDDSYEKDIGQEMSLDIDMRDDPQMAIGLFGLYVDGERDFSMEEITDNLFLNRR
jgi:transcription factor IIIB subunit 2